MDGHFLKGTGSYEIKELTTQDSVLKHLDKGKQYLECTSAGAVAWLSDQAFGEWEFDLLKTSTNIPVVHFINNSTSPNNGYGLRINNTEQVGLYEYAAGSPSYKFFTNGFYIDRDVWYRFKITRTLDGEFSVYIKGGDYGVADWTLIDDISLGTNPVTDTTYSDSIYMVLDFDAGDRISNIITRKAVQQ
jgi:hypothetical protein